MKSILLLFAALISSIGLSRGGDAMADTELKAGDVAPSFTMMGSDGQEHKLADSAGKQVVVVAWFPKAFTGG